MESIDPIFGQVSPDQLPPEYAHLLEQSDQYDFSGNRADDVLQALVDKTAQLWLYANGMDYGLIVTQILGSSAGRELFVWRLIGKGLNDAYEFIAEKLEAFAKMNDCKQIRTIILPQLAKFMLVPERGYKATGVILVKELPDG